jgi:hypothetical protein
MQRFDPTKIAVLRASATVTEMDLTEDTLRQAINVAVARATTEQQALAAVGPIGPNDKPRMLQLSAWICHSGKPNQNGFAMLKEDLEEAVNAGLFQAPFFGMVDFNHDFTAYGVWYDAKFAFDETAQEWGILAHGVIWAWRFSGLADTLLAAQQRNGKIEVSITALYKNAEVKEREDKSGRYLLIRKPIIMTTSVLDVDPADAHARGRGSEDPAETNDDRAAELLRAKLASFTAAADDAPSEEAIMNELVTRIEALLGERREDLKPLVEAATRLATVEQDLQTAQASLATATTERETLTASVESLTTEKATLETTLAAVREELAAATAELETLRAFKAEIETKAAEQARAERDAARQAEIPETVKAELEKRDDKATVLQSWMDQDDATWTVTKATLALATPAGKPSRSDRSAAEGILSSVSDTSRGGEFAIDRLPARK